MNKANLTVHTAATIAASMVMQRAVDEIPSFIEHALANAERRQNQPAVPNTHGYRSDYLLEPIPDFEPGPMMQSAAWRGKKGPKLGEAILVKPGTNDKLLVEQYGQDCSVLKKDAVAMEIRPGIRLVFNGFKVMAGEINHVIAQLGKKGWTLRTPVPKHQMELLAGGVT